MSNRPPDIDSIFFAALEIAAADQRAAYLDKVCGQDGELKGRLQKLICAHDSAGSFLNPSSPAVMVTQALPAAEQPGTVIGPYRLMELLGEGGMGLVYVAEQHEPVRRKVALKLIKPGMDSREVVARFEAERHALALMDHPNIARVLDAGVSASGRPYFVMELVKGVPITQYCDENRLAPRQRLELFVDVCQAVQHAHQKGIIHRDVKPTNVLVTSHDGRPVVKVIDFGVAKAIGQQLTERTIYTALSQMVGTPLYMSPEQAGMSGLDVDTRTDIYSLGVLLYELLTGTTPFDKARLKNAAYEEIRRIIREDEPQKPSTRLSDLSRVGRIRESYQSSKNGGTRGLVPPYPSSLASIAAQRHTEPSKLAKIVRGDLDWIVMKALEKDRGRRYETANGFAQDVQRYLADEPVQACPPTAAYRFRKFARRNKRILATIGVVALALIMGTAISAWQAIRATNAEGLAQTSLLAEKEARDAARQAQDDATRRLFEARLSQARAGSLSRRVGQRFGSLEALAEATKIAHDLKLPEQHFLELRNAAIACLALPDLRLAKQWPGWPEGSGEIDFDGELKHYARVDRHGAVSIRRVADDEQIARLPDGTAGWPRFSRDGKFLMVYSHDKLSVWKLGGPEPVPVVQLGKGDYHGFDFSPDCRHCAIGRVNAPIRLYDLFSGQPPRELPNGRAGAELAFHPQGHQIAVSCGSSVEIRDLATGKVDKELQHPSLTASRLAWHPEGTTLAVVCDDRRIHLWDVAAGNKTVVLEGITSGGTEIAFNHAGNLLASIGWEGKLRFWDPRTGQHLFSTWSGMPATPTRFSTDDRLLAADIRDGQLGLWEVAATDAYRTLVRAQSGGRGIYHNATIHADGRLLASGMYGGVGLWDLVNGRELDFIELPEVIWSCLNRRQRC